MNCASVINAAYSLNEVAQVVTNGTALHSSEQLAGQYAFDAAFEAGYGLSVANLEAHLDVLAEEGALFNYARALDCAKQFAAVEGAE